MGDGECGCLQSKHCCQEWEGRVCGEECVPEWGTMFLIFITLLAIWVPYSSPECHQFPGTYLLLLFMFLPGNKRLCCSCVVLLLTWGRDLAKPVQLGSLLLAQSPICDPCAQGMLRATPSVCRRCLLCVFLSNQILLFSPFLGFPLVYVHQGYLLPFSTDKLNL